MSSALLRAAVACALFVPMAGFANAVSLPDSHDVTMLPIDEVRSLLADRAAQHASRAPSTYRSVTGGSATQTMIGWVHADQLDNVKTRTQVTQLFDAGVPLLVTQTALRTDAETKAIQGVFGIASEAEAAYYMRARDGGVRMVSMANATGIDDRAAVFGYMQTNVESLLRTAADPLPVVSSPTVGWNAEAATNSSALPRATFIDTAYGPNGSFVTQDITIVRDVSASHDDRIVIAKSTFSVLPTNNGQVGNEVVIPDRYVLTQDINYGFASNGNGDAIRPALVSSYPSSNPSTDISFNDTQTTTTSYGFGVTHDTEAKIDAIGPSASAKLGLSFKFGREHVEHKAVSMTVRDYRVGTTLTMPGGLSTRATWWLDLADAVRGRADFFGNPATARQMTPMMRQANAEVYSKWRFPGGFEESISLVARPSVTNVAYDGRSVAERGDSGNGLLPKSVVSVPARLPWLTRETTVLIQSAAGGGACLSENGFQAGSVEMVTCPRDLNQRVTQWGLDEESRYRNRHTGRCLAFDPNSGGLSTQVCDLSLTQRWEWRADRLYTLYNGSAQDWRLHISASGWPNVKIDPSRFDALPTNVNHRLLYPWSSYPGKPVRGDIVPNFAGSEQYAVPEAWLTLKAVSPWERWNVIPLRQGI